jgi:hypothetical protein
MLTESLSRLGVLKKGDTVLLNLEELGGYEMGFYVSELEPADIVLLNAEEVVVEFEEAADDVVDDEGAEVADVRGGVDGGTAVVEADDAVGVRRSDRLEAAFERIVKL